MSMIYDDMHVQLLTEGASTTERASHVEPDGKGGWTADMSPVGGPILGPFALRREALDAEIEYLNHHVL